MEKISLIELTNYLKDTYANGKKDDVAHFTNKINIGNYSNTEKYAMIDTHLTDKEAYLKLAHDMKRDLRSKFGEVDVFNTIEDINDYRHVLTDLGSYVWHFGKYPKTGGINDDGRFSPIIFVGYSGQLYDYKEEIEEALETHTRLNPILFDEDNKLKKEVADKLIEIAHDYMSTITENDDAIVFPLKDIVLVGSNASYNYTKKSDIDLHLIVDSPRLEEDKVDLYSLIYDIYRSDYNKEHDISIKKIPVELYVEMDCTQTESNGVYSVLNDTWIKEPTSVEVEAMNEEKFEKEFKKWEDRYFDLITPAEEEIENKITDGDKESETQIDEGLSSSDLKTKYYGKDLTEGPYTKHERYSDLYIEFLGDLASYIKSICKSNGWKSSISTKQGYDYDLKVSISSEDKTIRCDFDTYDASYSSSTRWYDHIMLYYKDSKFRTDLPRFESSIGDIFETGRCQNHAFFENLKHNLTEERSGDPGYYYIGLYCGYIVDDDIEDETSFTYSDFVSDPNPYEMEGIFSSVEEAVTYAKEHGQEIENTVLNYLNTHEEYLEGGEWTTDGILYILADDMYTTICTVDIDTDEVEYKEKIEEESLSITEDDKYDFDFLDPDELKPAEPPVETFYDVIYRYWDDDEEMESDFESEEAAINFSASLDKATLEYVIIRKVSTNWSDFEEKEQIYSWYGD